MNKQRKALLYLVGLIILLVLPYIVYPVFLMQILCFVVFAVSFNLLYGNLGLLSFGHAAFFGAAAYLAGYCIRDYGLPPSLALVLGAGIGAVLGLLIGSLAIQRKDIYFAMITLALAQIIYFLALQLPFTGGENGLQGIEMTTIFKVADTKNDRQLYYVMAVIALICLAALWRINHSPLARVWEAIKDNDDRAISLGYDIVRAKLIAFVISTTFAGIAGTMKVIVLRFVSLSDVHWTTSGAVILMILLGGSRSFWGPVVGAVIVVTLENRLISLGSWVMAITGGIFVACVLLFKEGVVGKWTEWRRSSDRFKGSRSAKVANGEVK